jgi:hypothetical protein
MPQLTIKLHNKLDRGLLIPLLRQIIVSDRVRYDASNGYKIQTGGPITNSHVYFFFGTVHLTFLVQLTFARLRSVKYALVHFQALCKLQKIEEISVKVCSMLS